MSYKPKTSTRAVLGAAKVEKTSWRRRQSNPDHAVLALFQPSYIHKLWWDGK